MDYGATAVCNNTTGQIANNTVTAQNYDHIVIIKPKKNIVSCGVFTSLHYIPNWTS